jgi:choline transporter-like protein 2/4/5
LSACKLSELENYIPFPKKKDDIFLFLQRYVADIGKSWPVLLVCGGLVPAFLSAIWLLMIRFFVAGMPWITVVVFNALVISVTMFFYIKGRVL